MAQDYTTIRVTEAAKAQAEQSKREDETWNDYILRCSENPPEVKEYIEADSMNVDYAEVENRVEKALERVMR
jgi:hypothetical protein